MESDFYGLHNKIRYFPQPFIQLQKNIQNIFSQFCILDYLTDKFGNYKINCNLHENYIHIYTVLKYKFF